MPELRDEVSAFGVDLGHDLAPALDLLGKVQSRRPQSSPAAQRDTGRLGDDEAAVRGALRVVLGMKSSGIKSGWIERERLSAGMTTRCFRRMHPN